MNDGVISGVGFVLVFVPVIFAMMFFITFLEGSGYMARAAFVMDKAMHAIGLHGKSFIPMVLGFGCNVPGIYATRTLESQRDRVLTALLVPLMSCGARLPVYVLFVGVFFPGSAGTVIWSLYVVGIALAIAMGVLFKKTLFRGEAPAFIMELPPYRMPSLASLCLHTWEKGKHFLVKAGTYILAVSVLVWFLLNLPWGVERKKDSYLGQAGQVIAPALAPLGFGTWEAASSLLTGVIAKEIVVGTMAEIYAPAATAEAARTPRRRSARTCARSPSRSARAVKDAAANVVSHVRALVALVRGRGAGRLAAQGRGPRRVHAAHRARLHDLRAALHAVRRRRDRDAPGVRRLEVVRRRVRLPDGARLGRGARRATRAAGCSGSEADVSLADLVIAALVLAAAAYLLYRSFWRKGGACHGCAGGGCRPRARAPEEVALVRLGRPR